MPDSKALGARETTTLDASELLRCSILKGQLLVDPQGRELARVVDLVARFADEGYPPVTGVLVRRGDQELFVPLHRLAGVDQGPLVLADGDVARLTAFERRPGEVLLARDVAGRQVVYLARHHRGRLVVAGDLLLGWRDGRLLVLGACVGHRRRLLGRRSLRTDAIDWRDVEPFLHHVPTSRLRMRLRRLHELHPGQVADLVEEASPEEAAEIIEAVGEDRAFEADVFEELDQEHQLELVARRSDAEVAQLLSRMAPDDAADLLTELDQRRREPILAALEPAVREELRRLLSYNPDSAGGLMSPNRVVLPAGATTAAAIAELRARPEVPENLDTVFLVDDQGRLSGALPLVGLLRAPETAQLEELAQPDPPRVRTDADLVEVTLVMTDYNLTSLPVVDDDDRLVGVVTIDDVVEQLVPENWRRRADTDEA